MPPVVSIVGKSESGKTTLIEKLIPALGKRGFKVATIKHDVHGFEMDKPGKDTYRHFHAGARGVAIASDSKMALIKRLEGPISLDEMVERFFPEVDIVLTEGYKAMDKPKVEVFRKDVSKEPLCTGKDNLIALMGDQRFDHLSCPQFALDDVEALADFLQKKFLSKGHEEKITK